MKWTLLLLGLVIPALAADNNPRVTIDSQDTRFRHIRYFDDSHVILALKHHKLVILADDGNTKFTPIKETDDHEIASFSMDKYYSPRAYAFDLEGNGFFTNDQGKLWKKSNFLAKGDQIDRKVPVVRSHAVNPNMLLTQVSVCNLEGCSRKYFYSETKGEKWLPLGIDNADSCTFLQGLPEFTQGDEKTVVCGVNTRDRYGHVTGSQVISSSDWFKLKKELTHSRLEHGAVRDVRVKLLFLVVMVQNDRFDPTNNHITLLTLKTGESLDESNFGTSVSRGKVVFLPLSPLLLFIAITQYTRGHHNPLLTVYALDLTGLQFRQVLEKVVLTAILNVQTIEGVWFANTVENGGVGDDNEKIGWRANSKSQFSIDDGRTWKPLNLNPDLEETKRCQSDSGCNLHVFPPGVIGGDGHYETGATPGILMAVGNLGTELQPSEAKELKTWISRDGGSLWSMAIDEPTNFNFGDHGNAILALPWSNSDKYYFSLDQGKSWQTAQYPNNVKLIGDHLITAIDGLALQFVMELKDLKFITWDFQNSFDGVTCKDSDKEEVWARVDGGEPTCLYGVKQKFSRRKQDAQCFLNVLWEDLFADEEACECLERDFECAPGFVISSKDISGHSCVVDPKQARKLFCGDKQKNVKIPNKQKMDGDECKFSSKKLSDFITVVDFDCQLGQNDGDGGSVPANDRIKVLKSKMDGLLAQYMYIREGAPTHDDNEEFGGENIIVRTLDHIAYASENGGELFVHVGVPEKILDIWQGQAPGIAVLITPGERIYVSDDGGNMFAGVEAPLLPLHGGGMLEFDEKDGKKFIWFGCERGDFCQDYLAWITDSLGRKFEKLINKVTKCLFIHLGGDEERIFCNLLENGKTKLVLTTNRFKDTEVLFELIADYAPLGDYVVVAALTDKNDDDLEFYVTVDGTTFAHTLFPSDKSTQLATVLDSKSHALFMLRSELDVPGEEYGLVLKSNSNGTLYVVLLEDVNRNHRGFADYDRIDLLEGTLVANQVKNPGKSPKQLRTLISHNDGGEWKPLIPPSKDSEGKDYPCRGNQCLLNIHGYTDRPDLRDTFGLTLATGMLLGNGNVGEHLKEESDDETSTFMLNDGGVSWKEVAKGAMQWEFGDHGSVVVLVPKHEPANVLQYSTDMGDSWQQFKFTENPVIIHDLATSARDTSLKFVLFCMDKTDLSTVVYTVDFAELFDHQCKLDFDHPDDDDYEYWTPPFYGDGCMFGHRASYLRKNKGASCFVGEAPLSDGYRVLNNCLCTRQDYECDYNYVRDVADNTCKLVKGLDPKDRKEQMCSVEGTFQYFIPTGYRKLPLLTCVGGTRYDQTKPEACPGKEKEFREHYGYEVSGFKWFLLLGVPGLVFLSSVWFVYDRGIRRNGGFKRLGQIRLDEDIELVEENNTDRAVNAVVRGGIYAVAATYAAAKVIYRLDKALLERVLAMVRGRSRGTFVAVPEDDELFGDFRDEDAADFDEFEIPEEDDDLNVDERLFGIDDED